jgi:hypothetical protein
MDVADVTDVADAAAFCDDSYDDDLADRDAREGGHCRHANVAVREDAAEVADEHLQEGEEAAVDGEAVVVLLYKG